MPTISDARPHAASVNRRAVLRTGARIAYTAPIVTATLAVGARDAAAGVSAPMASSAPELRRVTLLEDNVLSITGSDFGGATVRLGTTVGEIDADEMLSASEQRLFVQVGPETGVISSTTVTTPYGSTTLNHDPIQPFNVPNSSDAGMSGAFDGVPADDVAANDASVDAAATEQARVDAAATVQADADRLAAEHQAAAEAAQQAFVRRAATLAQAQVVIQIGTHFVLPNALTLPPDQPTVVAIENVGGETHTFVIDGPGVDLTLPPGDLQLVTLTLPAGVYPYACRLSDALNHRQAGMVGVLTVPAPVAPEPVPATVPEAPVDAPAAAPEVEAVVAAAADVAPNTPPPVDPAPIEPVPNESPVPTG